jgi:transcriptional regulator with XRE-family HTH domain
MAGMSEDWWDYVARIAGPDATQKDISTRTGIEQSSISRWKLQRNTPNADTVIRFARCYDESPISALIAAGYLRWDELDGDVEIVTTPMSSVGTGEIVRKIRELFGELQRRVPEVGAIVDESQDWPESFFEGVSKKPPPVRRSKHR